MRGLDLSKWIKKLKVKDRTQFVIGLLMASASLGYAVYGWVGAIFAISVSLMLDACL